MRTGRVFLACCLAVFSGIFLESAKAQNATPQERRTDERRPPWIAAMPVSGDPTLPVEDAPASRDMLEEAAAVEDRVDLRTFRTPNLLLPADHWLGDWAGLRPRLEDNGITPIITWVTNLAGNPTGGVRQGFTECDNLGIDFMSDLQKICGMPNAMFHVSTSQRSGTSLSNEYIGNAFNVQQVYGGETFKLVDVEYIQRFCDGRVSFHGGRIAAGDDFLSSPYYWFFMSNGIDGNPVGIFKNAPGMSAYPNSTWGARLRVRPTERTYIMGGIYNGDPSIRDNDEHGMNFTMNGPAFLITEAAYQRNGLPGDKGKLGTYKIGAYYDANTFENFNEQILGNAAGMYGLSANTQHGNWGYYALVDQVILQFDDEMKRGVGVFASIIVSPDQEVSTMPFFCNGGVIWRGPFERRPTDSIGFAMIYGDFSDNLRNAQAIAHELDSSVDVQNYEWVWELSYRFRMREGAIFVQPDLQYVVHPNGMSDIPNALVVGCQMGVNF
jgi:porin